MSLSPAKRNKLLLAEMEASLPPDYMAIACFVTQEYEHYVPEWLRCIKDAYPKYDTLVIRKGAMKSLPDDPNRFAAARFMVAEDLLSQYPYVLITDVDMLIMRETPSILFQHLFWMRKHGLGCYSNGFTDGFRPSAVHFMAQGWWEVTREARKRYWEALPEMVPEWGMDELILGRIIIESGLPVVREPMLWNHHGVHLGAQKRGQSDLDGAKSAFMQKRDVDNSPGKR
jgi:hypothetical protein